MLDVRIETFAHVRIVVPSHPSEHGPARRDEIEVPVDGWAIDGEDAGKRLVELGDELLYLVEVHRGRAFPA